MELVHYYYDVIVVVAEQSVLWKDCVVVAVENVLWNILELVVQSVLWKKLVVLSKKLVDPLKILDYYFVDCCNLDNSLFHDVALPKHHD